MAIEIQGTEITPDSVDIKVSGAWVMGVDINKLPPSTEISDIRRNISVVAGHVYQSVTEFVGLNGEIKSVVSRANVVTQDSMWNALQTVGQLNSPINYTFYDIT